MTAQYCNHMVRYSQHRLLIAVDMMKDLDTYTSICRIRTRTCICTHTRTRPRIIRTRTSTRTPTRNRTPTWNRIVLQRRAKAVGPTA
eukprot:scaffold64654_cov20-Prasinocladus_malaysianus.AAC.1